MDACAIAEGLSARGSANHGLGEDIRRINRSYLSRNRDSDDEHVKQPQRERVLSHILNNHASRRLTLLSLPSYYWKFEHLLLDQWRGTAAFIGLEWNWGVMELGTPWVPGDQPRYVEYPIKIGTLQGIRTTQSRWLYVHAGDFLNLNGRDEIGSKTQRWRFAQRFKRNTCIWLDFTSNLCCETRRALRAVSSFCDSDTPRVPFAVTLMMGRECGGLMNGDDAISRRVPLIQRLLEHRNWREFTIADAWSYESSRGAPMLCVTGFLDRK